MRNRSGRVRATAIVALLAGGPLLAGGGFVETVEEAHGRAAWYAHKALETGITASFGGETFLEGTLLMTPDMGRVRIEHRDGTVLHWTGEEAFISPAASGFEEGRFHVLTWPYFLAAPFKLSDPGANVAAEGERPFRPGEVLPAARLTFDAGVGDSPDDWYELYREPESGRLAGMAYIVTFGGRTVAEAEAEPHVVVYARPVTIAGATLATEWTFYNWTPDEGAVGEPIGQVELRDPRFVRPPAGAFAPPPGARPLPLPETAH